jgi:hypothetical protein
MVPMVGRGSVRAGFSAPLAVQALSLGFNLVSTPGTIHPRRRALTRNMVELCVTLTQ